VGAIKSMSSERSIILLSNGKNEYQGYIISHIEIRQYVQNYDHTLGEYSLMTIRIETNKGSVELKYDEGFRGKEALEDAAALIKQYTGFAGLINRALIELQSI
jgi:hypothetical protein